MFLISVESLCDRVICCNDREGIGGSLPCFSFNCNIIIRYFVVAVGFVKRSLMGINAFEFKHSIFIFLVFYVVDNIVVGYNIYVFIIINKPY